MYINTGIYTQMYLYTNVFIHTCIYTYMHGIIFVAHMVFFVMQHNPLLVTR